MTAEEQKEFDAMKERLGKLERAFHSLLISYRQLYESSARRQKNLADRDEKFAALCADLADSVIGAKE